MDETLYLVNITNLNVPDGYWDAVVTATFGMTELLVMPYGSNDRYAMLECYG